MNSHALSTRAWPTITLHIRRNANGVSSLYHYRPGRSQGQVHMRTISVAWTPQIGHLYPGVVCHPFQSAVFSFLVDCGYHLQRHQLEAPPTVHMTCSLGDQFGYGDLMLAAKSPVCNNFHTTNSIPSCEFADQIPTEQVCSRMRKYRI